jgi:hypothetical protein
MFRPMSVWKGKSKILILAVPLVAVLAGVGAVIASNVHATPEPMLAENTAVTVRLDQSLSSESAHTGDIFTGSLTHDIVVDGKAVAKAGDPVEGRVTYARASGRLKDPGQITIRLTEVNGVPVTSTAVSRKGQSHKKSNWLKIGGGAVVGTLIGGLAGGGKGAAIGAGAGAAAGTGVAAVTGKKNVVLSAESTYRFTVSPAAEPRT